jgi:hypothetical protein
MLSLKLPGQTQAELGQAHVEQRMAGLDTIREIFSSEAILQEIQKGILDGTRQARIEEGQILGSRSGDLGRRSAAEKEVGNTTELLERVDRQLPNGWWLHLNLSAANINGFCRNLIALAGISEEDWQVEEE